MKFVLNHLKRAQWIGLCLLILNGASPFSLAENEGFDDSTRSDRFYILTDFDGTITNFYGEGFVSLFELAKQKSFFDNSVSIAIERILSDHGLNYGDLPSTIPVTQKEHALLSRFLAKKVNSHNYEITSYKFFSLPAFPEIGREKELYLPLGLYSGELHDNFLEKDALLKDYQRSKELLEKNKKDPLNLFGLGFFLLRSALYDNTNSEILLHTARGNPKEDFLMILQEIKKDGFFDLKVFEKLKTVQQNIRSIKDSVKIFNLGSPSGAKFDQLQGQRKAAVVQNAIRSIQTTSFTKTSSKSKQHIIFADDDIFNIEAINEIFQEASKHRYSDRLELFHILFTGPQEELKQLDTQNFTRFVTYKNGILKPIDPKIAKRLGLPKELMSSYEKEYLNIDMNCKKVFAKNSFSVKDLGGSIIKNGKIR